MGTQVAMMAPVTYVFFGLLALSLHQVSGDWTGSGELVCYSHYESDATFPDGASNEAPAKVTCRPVEWKYPEQDLGPEAMFFHPENVRTLKFGRGIIMMGKTAFHMPNAVGSFGTS